MSDEDSNLPLYLPLNPIFQIDGYWTISPSWTFSFPEAALLMVSTIIMTSGKFQFSKYVQRIRFVFSVNQIFRFDFEYAQTDRKSANRGVGLSKRLCFLVLTKRNATSGDKNALWLDKVTRYYSDLKCFFQPWMVLNQYCSYNNLIFS